MQSMTRRLLSMCAGVALLAATAGAALSRLLRDRTIGPDETTIVVLTGHGLKATDKIAELLDLH